MLKRNRRVWNCLGDGAGSGPGAISSKGRRRGRLTAAFTLIELLVTIAIVGVLAALVALLVPRVMKSADQAKSLSNMRQIGGGFQLYANDHDMDVPARVQTGDKWPKLIFEYLKDARVYADPSDPENILKRRNVDPLSNAVNNTSYMMNGFNQLGAYGNEAVTVRIISLEAPANTILLGIQRGHNNFYMDTEENNQDTVVNKEAFRGGSNYYFADGSVRFLKNHQDYSDALWDVRKNAAPE